MVSVDKSSQLWRLVQSGHWYLTNAKPLKRARLEAKRLCWAINQATEHRDDLISELLPNAKSKRISKHFYCDYGFNIAIGYHSEIGCDAVILDAASVTIGENVCIGNRVTMATINHHKDPVKRSQGWQCAQPIVIGDNVKLGDDVVVLPGSCIPDGAEVASGMVVTS